MIKMSAFQSLHGGQFTLSTLLINQIFMFKLLHGLVEHVEIALQTHLDRKEVRMNSALQMARLLHGSDDHVEMALLHVYLR